MAENDVEPEVTEAGASRRKLVRALRRFLVMAFCCVAIVAEAQAQTAVPAATQDSEEDGSKPAWSFRAGLATYVLPDDDNYVQPTVTADRGPLHLETRYNYENRHSMSGFVGWNFEIGQTVTLQLTPMFGAVAGDTDGIIPALEADLSWSRLELYSESEYVFDLGHRDDRFFYAWSEGSFWMADWLRAGVAVQRTRAYQTPRDTQWGPLVGGLVSKLEWAVYLFNPDSDDRFVVTSIGLTF